MKIKISKRVISLLLAILVYITAIPLTASAYMVNANGLPGTPGSVYVDGYGSWHLPDYGARVTLVDATTGEAIPEYVSIDYTNRNYVPLPNGTKIPIENAKHFGKWCKSDYRAGMPLSLAAENDKYQRIEPPAGFPRMLNSGEPNKNVSIEKVKEYFGKDKIIREFASNIGASFEEVTSGKYKLLVEPLVCISLPSINEAYVATITELAMYNSATKKANGGDYDVGFVRDKWGSDWLPKNWSKSLFLKEPDIGYEAWKPTAAAVDDNTIFQKLGLATISFDAGDPTVYHHICNIKLNIPQGAPDFVVFEYNPATSSYYDTGRRVKINSAVARDILLGKALRDTDGNEVKLSMDVLSGFIDYCFDNGFLSQDPQSELSISEGCWEEPYSYIPDKTAVGSGFETDDEGELRYFASKDPEFIEKMESYGVPYLAVSSEVTEQSPSSNVYVGPETGNPDAVVWRYSSTMNYFRTFENKYTKAVTSSIPIVFHAIDLTMNELLSALMDTYINEKEENTALGRVLYYDYGLIADPGQEFHTATYLISVEDAPTDVYHHTATYDIKLNPGDPKPTTIDEFSSYVKDPPTWTVEKSTFKDPVYIPKNDPKLNSGYVVGISGFKDKFDPQPTEYPDTTDAVKKLENDKLEFDPIPDPIKQVNLNTPLDVSAEGISEIHTAIIKFNIKEARQLEKGTDRIKTYDVTQFIDQTVANQASEHLKGLVDCADRENNYNSSAISGTHSGHVSDKSLAAVIESAPLSFSDRNQVAATNYVNQTTTECPGDTHAPCDTYCPGHDEEDGTTSYCDGCEDAGGYDCGSIEEYLCRYTKESVEIAYGVDPSVKQHYKDQHGHLNQMSGYKSPSQLVVSSKFTEVGFTIPHAYYSSPNVVKLHGSNKYSGSDQQFLLPDWSNKNADEYAVFDTLFDKAGDKYRIKYFHDSSEVKYQSHLMTTEDKKHDYKSEMAFTKFDYLSTKDNSINGVQYIAHRDLLSGDKVSNSLAVSSYMAKYADSSNTWDYLTFMRDSGFAFNVNGSNIGNLPAQNDINPQGANASIGHANRTVWIARAANTSDLAASADGYAANAYNTHYVGGKNEVNLRKDTYVRFGLGGLSTDGMNMYKDFIHNSPELNNDDLNETAEKGDALRSIWYTTNISDGAELNCYGSYSDSGHDVSCSECSAYHKCGIYSPLHSSVDVHKNWHSVSSNVYVLHDYDTHLTSGKYNSKAVFDQQQSEMFEDIYTSRLTFRIPLAVEGTINGQWDSNGINGIKYRTDILKLNGNYLTHKSSAEMTGANAKTQKTYEENTFEVLEQNLADVGKTNNSSDTKKLLSEYRFTTPTGKFHFNPSVAMAFDDDLKDVNKSVWMLSEQPREINFKNILDIRLTYNAKDKAGDRGASSGYTTTIDSEWSTDKLDQDIQKETGLPTIKASNSYKTETSAVGGTVTAYVVLQDPEFAPNYGVAQQYNTQTMAKYKAQLDAIRAQIEAAGGTITHTNKDSLGLAMYTNMTNGSSTNSMFYQGPFTSADVLADKEPMKLKDSTKLTAKVTSGSNSNISSSALDDNAWSFYALSGYKVVNNYGDSDNTDISDTTSGGKRSIFGQIIKSQDKAAGHQKKQLNELNEYLNELMFEQGGSVDAPAGTTPFKDGTQEFVWYNEDYEGFVVAVYEIEFAIGGKDGNISNPDANTHAKTDFHSVYRSESDWRTDTNAPIEETGRSLVADYSDTLAAMNVKNIINSTGKDDFNFTNGKLDLVTVDGRKQLDKWESKLKKEKYHGEIYGIGLELANLKIEFGDIKSGKMSFFYQPTYFNIRGSVYDTAR